MRRTQAEGGTSAFFWVAHLSSPLVVMATTSRRSSRHPVAVPFVAAFPAAFFMPSGTSLFVP